MSWLAAKGQALLEKGYPIVPILPGTKRPGLKGWQKINADIEQLSGWLSNGYKDGGVGVLTEHFPAIDIDCTDKELVYEFIERAREILGEDAPVRVGRTPKALLACRTDSPFPKVTSRVYTTPGSQESHRLEILGKGQQFVAFAEHPDTNQPYRWVKGAGLDEIDPQNLPAISHEQAHALREAFEQCAEARGMVARQSSQKEFHVEQPSDALATVKPQLGLSTHQLAELLDGIDPRPLSYDQWLKVGMALHHETDGDIDALNLFDRWSMGDTSRYQGIDDIERRWESFSAHQPGRTPVTAATLKQLAKPVTTTAVEPVPPAEPAKEGLLLNFKQLRAKLGPVAWTVEGFIESDSTGLIFGAPGSYKSFLALDLALCVATGLPWHGQKIAKPGPVVYVAGEGHNGLARRVEAWVMSRREELEDAGIDIDSIPFYVSRHAVNFNDAKAVTELREHVLEVTGGEAPAMLIVDTVARNYGGGDENSTADMNNFITNADLGIRHFLQCVLLLVHHAGHAAKDRARGSSALKGAVDFEYRCEREGIADARRMVLSCTKMKDAVEPAQTFWHGAVVDVTPGGGFIDGAEPITSLVLEQVAPAVTMMEDVQGVPAVQLMVWLLDQFGDGGHFNSKRVAEDASQPLGMSKSSVRRYLNEYVALGLLVRIEKSAAGGRLDMHLVADAESLGLAK